MQVVGIELASLCVIKEWPAQTEGSSSFRLVGLLPKPDIGTTHISSRNYQTNLDRFCRTKQQEPIY
jgi:hypothetical protein